MKDALRAYWPYVAVPFALVVGLFGVLWFLAGDGAITPYIYAF